MNRKKGKEYSRALPEILDVHGRMRIARQIYSVLKMHLKDTKGLRCLDFGCSSGVISSYLSDYFESMDAVDVDEEAIVVAKRTYKKKNLKFYSIQGEETKFKDNYFDVVICNQVYNFVDSSPKLVKEIHRVLKPGGICFFSARNKYAFFEPQYNLPFLSWLPESIALKYMKLFGKGDIFFGKRYLSYWGLLKLVNAFKIHDYTTKVLKAPGEYGFTKLEKYAPITRLIPRFLLPIVPNYIWILEKEK